MTLTPAEIAHGIQQGMDTGVRTCPADGAGMNAAGGGARLTPDPQRMKHSEDEMCD